MKSGQNIRRRSYFKEYLNIFKTILLKPFVEN